MNDLRWIILGIGLLLIATIYIRETFRRNRKARPGPSKTSPARPETITDIHISPKKDKFLDITGAAAAFNSYLRDAGSSGAQADQDGRGTESGPDNLSASETGVPQQEIIVLYIVTGSGKKFSGTKLLEVLESAGMCFGNMQIFHYQWHNEPRSDKALFSIANIHEPGTFDINNMASLQSNGLAMFMALPAEIGGDIAFEIMLDTAQMIAGSLQAELRGANHALLTDDGMEKLREIANRY